MIWELYEYSSNSGQFNMQFDIKLANQIAPNTAALRFYGWSPFCISLGANQSYEDINQSKTISENIDIVKRPTGGRAILHADELTYSVVIPNASIESSRKLYENISKAIVIGLKNFDESLEDVELANSNPNFKEILQNSSGSLCFASTAKSEIKYMGKKLVGSAQRRMGKTILQHGSILIGNYHEKLVDYLNVDDQERMKLISEINDKTIDLRSILNYDIDLFDLQNHIISGFKDVFLCEFCQPVLENFS